MLIPLNTLNAMYKLNSEGVPCFTHSSDNTIATQPITERFDTYTTPEQFINSGVKYLVPMTAKEIEDKEEQQAKLHDNGYYVEEKFDGTRGIMQFFKVPTFESRYPNWVNDEEQYFLHCLTYGSGFVGGKRRIFDYLHTHNGSCAKFLANEYGTGGMSGGGVSFSYTSKGLEVSFKNLPDRLYTWTQVEKGIRRLIQEGLYYPQEAYTRVFSRRISVTTNWFSENTDKVPQLRDLNIPELEGTVIDGEMFIPNQPFKAVSSTLNCKADKAITRQLELGGIVFHAFDILFFKGIDLRKMPLERRKVYLNIVCNKINSVFVREVNYYDKDGIEVKPLSITDRDKVMSQANIYPNLAKDIKKYMQDLRGYAITSNQYYPPFLLTKASYYEYIVFTGGEGVVIKPKTGRYYHKRGREYEKIKKFLTRECIICNFTEPTKKYEGKFPNDSWSYWVDKKTGEKQDPEICATMSAKKLQKICTPVTRYYFEDWVGNVEYGVLISEDEIKKLPKNKKHDIRTVEVPTDYNNRKYLKVIVVGECSGFDDDERAWFTEHREELIGQVIEVKANEIFKDTGKLRHPRYLRLRPDKSPSECTFKDHING